VETVAFLETTGDRHTTVVAGLTALERRIRECAKAGATRVVVAAEPVAIARPLPVPVDYVGRAGQAPEGATRERADIIAGVELVDDAARKRAEWALIRRMNKAHEGPVDALVNWRFSMRITRMLSRRSLAVTPNHVTIVSILVGLLACWCASRGTWAGLAVGGGRLGVRSTLDGVDGELARLRFQYSKVGQWLDNLADDIVDNLFILACGWTAGGVWWWLAVAAACGRWFVALCVYIWVYSTTGTGDVFAFRWWFERADASHAEVYKATSVTTWLRSLGRRDTYVFVWMVVGIAGFAPWVPVHGLVIAAINVTLLVLHFVVFRGRRQLA